MYRDTIREIAAELGHVGADPYVLEGWLRMDPDTGDTRCLDGMSRAAMKRNLREILAELATVPTAQAERISESYMGPRR